MSRPSSDERLNRELDVLVESSRLPVEEISPERERQLLQRLRPALDEIDHARQSRLARWAWSRVWLGGAFAAAAAGLLAVVWVGQRPEPTPDSAPQSVAMITHWSGAVAVVGSSGQERAVVRPGTRLSPPETIAAGGIGRFAVQLGHDRVVGFASTRLRLDSAARQATALTLTRGTMMALVETRRPGPGSFQVTTELARVVVTGTLLRVETRPRHLTVAVAEGAVDAHLVSGEVVTIGAGEMLVIDGATRKRRSFDAPTRSSLFAEIDPATWPEAIVEFGSATSDVEPPAAMRPETLADRPRTRVRTEGREKAKESLPTRSALLAELSHLTQTGACADAAARLPLLTTTGPTAERAHATVMVANCYYSRGDLAAALPWYQQAAARYPRTAAGENAAYENGRVALRLGRLHEAREAFETYLRRNPRGVLGAEARFRLCSIAMDEDQNDEALACLRRYRQKHPGGERVAESHFLEATLLRGLGDCAAAIAAYDTYLRNPGEFRQQAVGWRAWCANELKKTSE